MTEYSIVTLDRRLSRAVECGKGLMLEARDVDLLASIGLFEAVHSAKNAFIQEQTRCRIARRQSIDGGNTGLDGTGKPTGLSVVPTSPSSGTTSAQDESEALQRARRSRKKA